MMPLMGAILILFLSTLSLRRATQDKVSLPPAKKISIHALLAESDECLRAMRESDLISIHALLAESDSKADRRTTIPYFISIHALLAESD